MSFKQIKNLGYWSVNGVEFNNKVKAILHAQELGLDHTSISYHYNDAWWDQLNWATEPNESLEDLYLRRAKQLRDKYETLVLRFSGGADSTNVLRTFVENGIKLDVVSINMWYQDGVDPWIQPSNIEKRDIAIPFATKLKEQGADFELVISNFSSTFESIGHSPEWILNIDAPRFTSIDISAHRSISTPEYAKWNKPTTAVIMGVDKPQVWCKAEKIWYFSIPDYLHTMHHKSTEMIPEPFYWNADVPQLVVKQAHCVKKYYQQHKDKLQTYNEALTAFDKKFYIPLIYPKYYGNLTPGESLPYYDMTLDALKFKNNNGNAPRGTGFDFGLEKLPNYETWKSGIELADRIIDSRFKTKDSIKDNGLIPIYTKPRWLGN
jgi:hypothetical protein